jgi:TonB family protein
MEGWNKYLVKNLKYPKEARKKGIGGIAYLYFKIDEEGVMQDVAITNPESIFPLLAEEAIRVMTSYPYVWTPAKVDGKPVNVEMRFPLRFVSP